MEKVSKIYGEDDNAKAMARSNITPASAHYYTLKGEPSHFNEKGKPTTLREARKLSLLPSITTVLGVVAAEGLNRWRENQIALAVYELDQAEGEPRDDFFRRCIDRGREATTKAAERGTEIHAVAESLLKGETVDVGDDPQKKAVADWVGQNVQEVIFSEKPLVHPQLAMAGCADACVILKDHPGPTVIDFKTRKFKPYKTAPEWRPAAYKKDVRQLAFYADCLADSPRVANVFINTATDDPWPAEIKIWSEEEVAAAIEGVNAARVLWCDEHNYWPEVSVDDFCKIFSENMGAAA